MIMTIRGAILCGLLAAALGVPGGGQDTMIKADPSHYLDDIKAELKKEWPANRTVNLVFHGHSVPAGYFKTPEVRTLEAYPHLLLTELRRTYPLSVINVIVTAIGGENAVQGEARFGEVLAHKPDVVFIDYALNDRGTPPDQAGAAWESMIRQALAKNVKVILLTPTPDQTENILDPDAPLAARTRRIEELAARFGVGLVDSYGAFKDFATAGGRPADLMSQVNHPNEKGHRLVAAEIIHFFN
ncbi:MAG: SGNH/GDSL hydrolase family protein [Acidobacteriota bacterium]|nr:SGNH/GDSL hydrolase family protein [Acidobacteriota bacterium]